MIHIEGVRMIPKNLFPWALGFMLVFGGLAVRHVRRDYNFRDPLWAFRFGSYKKPGRKWLVLSLLSAVVALVAWVRM